MWRRRSDHEDVVSLEVGVSLGISPGTAFQFRAFGPAPLEVVGVTMPPWPVDRDDEATAVDGPWPPTAAE